MQPVNQEVQDATTKVEPVLITRFMANQRLSSGFCNGDKQRARIALSKLKGIQPESHDRHMIHLDREVFNAAELAEQLFPNSAECREAFMATTWEHYAKKVDKDAITAAKQRMQ